jgi:hypothetical protein
MFLLEVVIFGFFVKINCQIFVIRLSDMFSYFKAFNTNHYFVCFAKGIFLFG